MDNEGIKEALKRICPTDVDFTVVMTGKSSRRVNGLYKTDTHEIILHNKNFKSDNQIMYTAIHEYTHHIQNEHGKSQARAHDNDFWAKFYSFIDKAIELGIYSREYSEGMKDMIQEANEIQGEILAAQKRLGIILQKIHDECDNCGARYEDVVEHDLQMKRATAVSSSTVSNVPNSEDIKSTDAALLYAHGNEQVKRAVKNGMTLPQAKATSKNDGDGFVSKTDMLEKEKRRIERTLDALEQRLADIENMLEKGE